jgi:hypothetical protein
MAEDGWRRTDGGRQRSEDRGQRTEVGRQRAEDEIRVEKGMRLGRDPTGLVPVVKNVEWERTIFLNVYLYRHKVGRRQRTF